MALDSGVPGDSARDRSQTYTKAYRYPKIKASPGCEGSRGSTSAERRNFPGSVGGLYKRWQIFPSKLLVGFGPLYRRSSFSTLDSATRSVDLGQGYQALITDTVGFIRKLPHHLVASFHSTLEEAKEANLLLHVIDASRQDWEDQHDVVMGVLSELGLANASKVLVFNKVDLITHAEEEMLRRRIRAIEPTPAVFVSAKDKSTLLALRRHLVLGFGLSWSRLWPTSRCLMDG